MTVYFNKATNSNNNDLTNNNYNNVNNKNLLAMHTFYCHHLMIIYF